MKIIKDKIKEKDKIQAVQLLNKLRVGQRVFGNPGEGLKKTLKSLELKKENLLKNKGVLDVVDPLEISELDLEIRKIKAGIKGEEELAAFIEKAIKHDKKLNDLIVFASLSDPNFQNSKDYISDSDFIFVYGNHILIVDAKNVPTSPEIPIFISKKSLMTPSGVVLYDIHSSVFIWKTLFAKNNVRPLSIKGCSVIINKSGALIWKNEEWSLVDTPPLHLSELLDFLYKWIENKDAEVNLSLLNCLVNFQIKKDELKNKGFKDHIIKTFGI